jgi:hypothetical protein
MKPIKKFSTEMNQPKSILESLDSKALDELIKGMGFKDIHELKREKNLLSKLEALLKEVNPKQDISEDDAEEIVDDIKKKGEPKSLEDVMGEKEPETPVGKPEEIEEEEETEDKEETEEESDEDEMDKKEDSEDKAEVEVEVEDSEDNKDTEDKVEVEVEVEDDKESEDDEVEAEEESEKTPKATRRIMTFEDFVQEETKTINKNVSYRDDDEEKEDYAVVVASKDNDMEVEETVSTTKSAVKSFSQFVNEAYVKKSAVKEAFTFADAVDTAGEDVKKNEKGIASALKALKARTASDISIMTDTTEDDGLFDAIEGMKELSINSSIYDNAYLGKYKGKDVVVFGDGEDLFAYVKEGVGEVITKIEGDEIADEVAGADGIAIPTMKGDGSETAAGIAGDIMAMGKPEEKKEEEGEELVTKDQEITKEPETSKDEAETQGKVVVKESVNEAEIKSDEEFKEYAFAVLQQAFGDDFDEAKAQEVVDGLISKYSGDYGAMVGALQSTMGS